MSRRIVTIPTAPSDAAPGAPPDDYLGRLVKYIPAEVVALYLAAAGVVPDGHRALWFVFLACAILTPIYFWKATTRDAQPPLIPQIVLATLAFPVWVFAIGGPFQQLSWYADQRWIASLVLIFVTALFALYQPRE